MNASQINGAYSADVRIQLIVNGHILPVAQLGPHFLILRNAIDHPPTDAEIVMSIDGDVKQWPVRLPAGIAVGKVETPIVNCNSAGDKLVAE